MAKRLEGRRVAFLATDGVEQIELTEPWKKVQDEGGTPELISLESGEIQGFNHLDKGDTFEVDKPRRGRRSRADYDGLVLPGGVANPDFLRADENAVRFIARLLRGGQAGGGDLPRPLDARRGRRRPGTHAHLVAEPQDRHQKRRRQLGGRGGPRRLRARDEPQARRPPRLLRQGSPKRSARAGTMQQAQQTAGSGARQ